MTRNPSKNTSQQRPNDFTCNELKSLQIVFFGGCGEFGANITGLIQNKKLFLIDCGVRFPEPEKLGIDIVFPDLEPYLRNVGGVYAYLVTHGHEDHLGALPYYLEKWPAPVYGSAWTITLLRDKLKNKGIDPETKELNIVESGDNLRADELEFEWINVNHSIPQSMALLLKAYGKRLFFTGDLKIKGINKSEENRQILELEKISKQKIDMIFLDSTNSETDGFCPSETAVLPVLRKIVTKTKGLVFFTTFSSNLERLLTVAKVSQECGRKIFIYGQGMERTAEIAKTLGMGKLLQDISINEEEVRGYHPRSLLVMVTGCQAEWRSSLARICIEEDKLFRISPEDSVILSARIIPGNERAVQELINKISKTGANVFATRDFPEIHVSGHSFGKDLKQILKIINPRYLVPVHGTYPQLRACADIGKGLNIETILVESGDTLEYSLEPSKEGVRFLEKITMENIFIDAGSSLPITKETLRERLKIGELGLVTVFGLLSKKGDWILPPQISMRGVPLAREHDFEKIVGEVVEVVCNSVRESVSLKILDLTQINEEARISIRRFFNGKINKKPEVISQIFVND